MILRHYCYAMPFIRQISYYATHYYFHWLFSFTYYHLRFDYYMVHYYWFDFHCRWLLPLFTHCIIFIDYATYYASCHYCHITLSIADYWLRHLRFCRFHYIIRQPLAYAADYHYYCQSYFLVFAFISFAAISLWFSQASIDYSRCHAAMLIVIAIIYADSFFLIFFIDIDTLVYCHTLPLLLHTYLLLLLLLATPAFTHW